jgi:ethanolamine utilization protein EutQ (cupin superfamily)
MEIKRVCAVCGNEFTARNHNARYCSYECVKTHNRVKNQKLKQEKAKALKQSREHNLNRTLYNLHKYNEENGTRLSYGQYRAKIESGEIAI